MHEALTKCRANFGERPRQFSLWDRLSYLRIPKPLWLRLNPDDQLSTHFANVNSLLRDGIVVWGYIIQANSLLFEAGPHDCPGELLYSLEDANQVEPEQLHQLSRELSRLKGTQPNNPQLQPIAHYLTDEMIRVFGLPVPSCLSPFVRFRISTTYFVRKHLPKRRLCSPLLPIIVSPQAPHIVTTLPEKFWPKELVQWWTED